MHIYAVYLVALSTTINPLLLIVQGPHGLAAGAMDLLNYSSMNPWLSMFPFGMMPPGAMFNPMVGTPQGVGSMTSSTSQPSNSLSSPPILTSPTMESSTAAVVSRQHSMSAVNQQQVH